MNDSVMGALLAGGSSRRMGRDKALLPLKGKPIIQHVCETLRRAFTEVIVISGAEPNYSFLGVPVLRDMVPGCGPLGGLHTALVRSAGRPVFVAACDLPFLRVELIRYILHFDPPETPPTRAPSDVSGSPLAKVPLEGGRWHPLCAFYAAACLTPLQSSLQGHQLKMQHFLERISALPVPITSTLPFYDRRLFYNINTPEKYEALSGHPAGRL